MKLRTSTTILFFFLSIVLNANGNKNLKEGFNQGNPEIESIKAIAFGPDNILFIGDNYGRMIYAIDVAEKKSSTSIPAVSDKIVEKLAALIGADKGEIKIQDMAINPLSKNVFLAVSWANESKTKYAIFKLGSVGFEEVVLDNVNHSKIAINNAPTIDSKTWNNPSRTYTVTDLHYINGEIIVSGLSNEEFSSGLRRIPFPFKNSMITTNVQVYHVSHGRNETHAPIYRFLPVKLENQWHIVAGYMCTPLVTFKLGELNGNKKLIGKTVAEIGAGNAPTGIITYNYDGQSYILVGNNVHPLTKITGKDLFNASAIKSPSREKGVKRENVRLGSIAHIVNYDETHFIIVTRDRNSGSYRLQKISKGDI